MARAHMGVLSTGVSGAPGVGVGLADISADRLLLDNVVMTSNGEHDSSFFMLSLDDTIRASGACVDDDEDDAVMTDDIDDDDDDDDETRHDNSEELASTSRPHASSSPPSQPFAYTRRTRALYAQLQLAINQRRRPILVEGISGAGKSALLHKLSKDTNANPSGLPAVIVHLDDAADARSLLGSYQCTDVPGAFAWVPGVLTKCARKGQWLILEDVDKAPRDVLFAIAPMLERGQLASRLGKLHANFRLIATACTTDTRTNAVPPPAVGHPVLSTSSRWLRVFVPPPGIDEVRAIATKTSPTVPARLRDAMIDAFDAFQRATGQHGIHGNATTKHQAPTVVHRITRRFTMRDLLQWLRRLDRFHRDALARSELVISRLGADAPVASIPHPPRRAALQEGIDLLCAAASTREAMLRLFAHLAGSLGFLPEEADELTAELEMEHKPSIHSEGNAELVVGRVRLPCPTSSTTSGAADVSTSGSSAANGGDSRRAYAISASFSRLLERCAASLAMDEPMLIVGETGVGKTASVQELTARCGQQLVVVNMSQQSDASDLLGGYQPAQIAAISSRLYIHFESVFLATFPRGANEVFLRRCYEFCQNGRYTAFLKGLRRALAKAKETMQQHQADHDLSAAMSAKARVDENATSSSKMTSSLRRRWNRLATDVEAYDRQVAAMNKGTPSFVYAEGALASAVREGHWLLLDEVNLAPAEVLQRLAGVLEGQGLVLAELGDVDSTRSGDHDDGDDMNEEEEEEEEEEDDDDADKANAKQADQVATPRARFHIPRHPNFRLIACMNPSTDVGKRDLPAQLRSRFTEVVAYDITDLGDLEAVGVGLLSATLPPSDLGPVTTRIAHLYLALKAAAVDGKLVHAEGAGGVGGKAIPTINLRLLCRAMEYAAGMAHACGWRRSLLDGLCMMFLTPLSSASQTVFYELVRAHLFADFAGSAELAKPPMSASSSRRSAGMMVFHGYPVHAGPNEPESDPGGFVATPSVQVHLSHLSRAISIRKYPILLQGPTSSGKTSLVSFIARQTGHTCIRINNHEHTDLAEYFGTYVAAPAVDATADGRASTLVFKEGPLVQAIRKGHWVILDELNLAPTDVLESLNRLLDDNRELYVPELNERITPHPSFLLFATQNPASLGYGGRKQLSKALRSRFLELYLSDIPDDELATIIEARCRIAPSHARKLVDVMSEVRRSRLTTSSFFAGRQQIVTPRDLIRWGSRGPVETYVQLAQDGFMVLGERLRTDVDRSDVVRCIQKVLRVELDMPTFYHSASSLSREAYGAYLAGDAAARVPPNLRGVAFTPSMQRLLALVHRCIINREPVLLVGESGCGKTTVVQILALLHWQMNDMTAHQDTPLLSINCHQHTETSDFLGGYRPQRPARTRAKLLDAIFCIDEAMARCGMPSTDDSAAMWEALREARESEDVASMRAACRACLRALADEPPSRSPKRVRVEESESKPVESDVEQCVLDRLHSAMRSLSGAEAPFEWVDGPLLAAMKSGLPLLIDEISLAGDAILERLNSVLEPERSLTVTECFYDDASDGMDSKGMEIVASDGFALFATMNPGGDFGKRELSPALRSRFTEIYVPAFVDAEELAALCRSRFGQGIPEEIREQLSCDMVRCWSASSARNGNGSTRARTSSATGAAAQHALSLRDLLAWSSFIEQMSVSMGLYEAFAHGLFLVQLDGIGLGGGGGGGGGSSLANASSNTKSAMSRLSRAQRDVYVRVLAALADVLRTSSMSSTSVRADHVLTILAEASLLPKEAILESVADLGLSGETMSGGYTPTVAVSSNALRVGQFSIQTLANEAQVSASRSSFHLAAASTAKNGMRVLRAMQLDRPVLLEGSPGVGKTALVAALAKLCERRLIRINLSEQTDIADLLGSDLPSGTSGDVVSDAGDVDTPMKDTSELHNTKSSPFEWIDGPLLQAVKEGHWCLLDELNLATQPVLEGLNSLLDHRKMLYIPELDKEFHVSEGFRLFGAQNPLHEGGGRKGLPQSFLNRFTRVYAEPLNIVDMQDILSHIHPEVPMKYIEGIVHYTTSLHHASAVARTMGREGAPWEFNLRDAMRWCEVSNSLRSPSSMTSPEEWIDHLRRTAELVYVARFRNEADKAQARVLFATAFHVDADSTVLEIASPELDVQQRRIACGGVAVERHPSSDNSDNLEDDAALISTQLLALPSMIACVKHGWMCLVTGPPSSGKTTLVRMLARLTGRSLTEVSIGPGTDVNDLLGSFEQQDPQRDLDELSDFMQRTLTSAAESVARSMERIESASSDDVHLALKRLSDAACSVASTGSSTLSAQARAQSLARACIEVDSVLEAYQEHLPAELAEQLRRIGEAVQRKATPPASEESDEGTTRPFTWVDGPVVRAMERGEWLLLDNANLCNPAVLDRLNSLLDQGAEGAILLNESGDAQRVLRMRNGFQLFLALNPRASSGSAMGGGELSRAMRNRGVEVAIASPRRIEDIARMIACSTSVPMDPRLIGALASLVAESANDKRSVIDAAHVADAAAVLLQHGVRSTGVYASIAGCSASTASKALAHIALDAIPLGTWPIRRGLRMILRRSETVPPIEAALRDFDTVIRASARVLHQLLDADNLADTTLDRDFVENMKAICPPLAAECMLMRRVSVPQASTAELLQMLCAHLRTYMQRASSADVQSRASILTKFASATVESLVDHERGTSRFSSVLAWMTPLVTSFLQDTYAASILKDKGTLESLAPSLIWPMALQRVGESSPDALTMCLLIRTIWDVHALRETMGMHAQLASSYIPAWRRSLKGSENGDHGDATLLHAALYRHANPLDEASFAAFCSTVGVRDGDGLEWLAILPEACAEVLSLVPRLVPTISQGHGSQEMVRHARIVIAELSALVSSLTASPLSAATSSVAWHAGLPAYHWARIQPRLSQLLSSGAPEGTLRAPRCLALAQSLGVATTADAPLLWRHGGRPHLSSDLAVNELEAEVRRISLSHACVCSSSVVSARNSWRDRVEYLMSDVEMRGDPPPASDIDIAWHHLDAEVRRSVVDAICLFDHSRAYVSTEVTDSNSDAFWACGEKTDPAEMTPVDSAAVPSQDSLTTVVASLRQLLCSQDVPRNSSKSMMLPASTLARPESHACALVLLAFLERRALAPQVELEADVARLAATASLATFSMQATDVARISSSADELSRFVIDNTASSLLDVAPMYQLMHLVHYAVTGNESHNEAGRHKLATMLPHISHELRYRTQVALSSRLCDAFLWRASQSMRFGSGGRARRLIAISSGISSQSSGDDEAANSGARAAQEGMLFTLLPSSAEGFDRLNGIASLLVAPSEAMLTAYVHLSVANGSIVIAELEHAIASLACLRRAMLAGGIGKTSTTFSESRAARSIARKLLYVMSHTLAIHAPTFAAGSPREQAFSCAMKLSQLASTGATGSQAELASSQLVSVCEVAVAGLCDHLTFVKFAAPMMHRAARELPSILQMIITDCTSDWKCLAPIGALSICLGVALAALSTPPAHGDPVNDLRRAAGSLRVQADFADTVEIPLDDAGADACTQPGAPGADNALARARQWKRTIKWWRHRADALESGASARREESSYRAFSTEARRLMESSLKPEFALNLMDSSRASSADAQAEALLSWCTTLEAFADSTERRYGDGLRDVAQPLLLGVREAASGARTLALDMRTRHGRGVLPEADSLLISLMSYPSVPITWQPAGIRERLDALCKEHGTQLCSAQGISEKTNPNVHSRTVQRERENMSLSVQRTVLVAAACDVQTHRQFAISEDWSVFEEVVMGFVRAWEQLQERKEEEARLASSLFQQRPSRASRFASTALDASVDLAAKLSALEPASAADAEGKVASVDDKVNELLFQRSFPDYARKTFGEFLSEDDHGGLQDAADVPRETDAALSHALETDIAGDVLRCMESCALHNDACSFLMGELGLEASNELAELVGAAGERTALPLREAFTASYDVGAVLLGAAAPYAIVRARRLERATMGGHVYRSCLLHEQYRVVQPAAAEHASASSVDVQCTPLNALEFDYLQPPLKRMRARVSQLLDEFPEHLVLQQLLKICDRLASLPINAPIKETMAGVELALGFSQTWETAAARHVSLKDELTALSAVARRWRSMELNGWPLQLRKVESECATSGLHRSVYHLLALMLPLLRTQSEGASSEGEHAVSIAEVRQALEEFLACSTIGDASERLRLLWVIFAHARTRRACLSTRKGADATQGRARQLERMVYGLIRCSMASVASVREKRKSLWRDTEKELRDFAAITRWEDRGYHAMRQHTERVTRQLHKLLMKYRESLCEAASTAPGVTRVERQAGQVWEAVANAVNVEGDESTMDDDGTVVNNFVASNAQCISMADANSPDDGGRIVSRSRQLVTSILISDGRPHAYTRLLVDLKALGDTSQQIRDTARTLASREKVHNAALKRQVLKALLTSLKNMGVGVSRNAVPPQDRSVDVWLAGADAPRIGTKGGALGALVGTEDMRAVLDAENSYRASDRAHFALIDHLRILRVMAIGEASGVYATMTTPPQPHKDLSEPEIRVLHLMAEHLAFLSRDTRRFVCEAAELGLELNQHANVLRSFVESMGRASEHVKVVDGPDVQHKLPSFDDLDIVIADPVDAKGTGWDAVNLVRMHNRLLKSVQELVDLIRAAAVSDRDCTTESGVSLQECESSIQAALAVLSVPAEELRAAISTSHVSHVATPVVTPRLANAVSAFEAPMREFALASLKWRDIPGADAVIALAIRASHAASATVLKPVTTCRADLGENASLGQLAERCVKDAQLWMQRLHKASVGTPPPATVDDDEDAAAFRIPECRAYHETRLAMVQARTFAKSLRLLLRALSSPAHVNDSVDNVRSHIASIRGLLEYSSAAFHVAMRDFLHVQAGLTDAAMCFVLLSTDTIEQGLRCESKQEDAGDDGEEADEAGGKELTGTGLGEGEGDVDVSKEITEEHQIEGLKDDEPMEEPTGGEQKKDEKGIEVADDFAADLEDVDLGDDKEMAEDDPLDEENPEDAIERQMGDLGDDGGEAVDERLWDDGDGGVSDAAKAKEAFDDSGRSVDARGQETDMVAAEEFGEKEKKDKRRRQEDKGKGSKQAPEDGGAADEEEEQEDGMDEDGGGQENDDGGDDGDAAKDRETNDAADEPPGGGGRDEDDAGVVNDPSKRDKTPGDAGGVDGTDFGELDQQGGDDEDENARAEEEDGDGATEQQPREGGEEEDGDDSPPKGDGTGAAEEEQRDKPDKEGGEEDWDMGAGPIDNDEEEGDAGADIDSKPEDEENEPHDGEDAMFAKPEDDEADEGEGEGEKDQLMAPAGEKDSDGADNHDHDNEADANALNDEGTLGGGGEAGGGMGLGGGGGSSEPRAPETGERAQQMGDRNAPTEITSTPGDTRPMSLDPEMGSGGGGGGDSGGAMMDGGSAMDGASGGQMVPLQMNASAQQNGNFDQAAPPIPTAVNPYRSLGKAMEDLQRRLNVIGESARAGSDGGNEEKAPDAMDFEFVNGEDDANDGGGGMQALGAATAEQALQQLQQATDADQEKCDDDAPAPAPFWPENGPVPSSQPQVATEAEMEDANDDADKLAATVADDDVAKLAEAAARRRLVELEDLAMKTDRREPDEEKVQPIAEAHLGLGEEDLSAPLVHMSEEELRDDGDGDNGDDNGEATEIEPLDPLEQVELRERLRQLVRARRGDDTVEDAEDAEDAEARGERLWATCESLTNASACELSERLRHLLEPTLASRLAGDYKTGKRLNMRRVVSYVASNYRKDKIWLRRTKVDKRAYQVIICVDDSRSMRETGAAPLAMEATALIAKSLTRLEVGDVGVCAFGGGDDDVAVVKRGDDGDGDDTNVSAASGVTTLHELGAPFTDTSGAHVFASLAFDRETTVADTPVVSLLRHLRATLAHARGEPLDDVHATTSPPNTTTPSMARSSGGVPVQQLVLIIGDGRFHEKQGLQRAVNELASTRGVLVAFVALDGVVEGAANASGGGGSGGGGGGDGSNSAVDSATSIVDLQSVRFQNGAVVMNRYMDTFPFPYYAVVRNISTLPEVVASLVQQWIELAASGGGSSA